MFITYIGLILDLFILAGLIFLIVLFLRKGTKKTIASKKSDELNLFKDLKHNIHDSSVPNHDNMTVSLSSLENQGDSPINEACQNFAPSIEDIPPMVKDEKTVGMFSTSSNNNDLPGLGMGGLCHAVIEYDDNKRTVFYEMFENTVLIGRDPVICDIVLQGDKNKKVSRCHALLRYMDNMLYICDLNSQNKTYINNQEINGKVPVRKSCTILLGESPVKIKLSK